MKAKPRFTANNIGYLIETIINQNILLATNDQNNSFLADNDLNIACSILDNSTIQFSDKWLQYIDVKRYCFLCDFHNDVYLLIRNIIGLQKYSALWTDIMQKKEHLSNASHICWLYTLDIRQKRIGKTKIILFSAECIFKWKTYLTNLLAHII